MEKKLKTLTFPGLEDAYTIPQVDDGRDGNFGKLDGSGNIKDSGYRASDFGSAKAVDALLKLAQGQIYDTQSAAPGTVPAGAVAAELKRIGGKTVVWNQQIDPDNYSFSSVFGATAEKGSGTTIILTGKITSTSFINLDKSSIVNFTAGHKYYFSGIENGGGSKPYLILRADGAAVANFYRPAIFTAGAYNSSAYLRLQLPTGWDAGDGTAFTILCVDLTKMFGAGNEPADTSDSRIAAIEAYYALHPGYDAGTLLHAPVKALKSTGADGSTVDTLQIPDEVLSFLKDKDYGAGITSTMDGRVYDNEIIIQDDNMTYEQACKTVGLADLDWTQRASETRFFASSVEIRHGFSDEALILSEKYTVLPAMPPDAEAKDGSIWQDSTWDITTVPVLTWLCIEDSSCTTVEALKEKLGDARIAFACYEKTYDLTPHWAGGSMLNVEGGGTLTFEQDGENGMELDIGGSVDYLIKLSEV